MSNIYIFYSPEMVARKKRNTKEEKQKNTQISKAKARKTNLLIRQSTQISKNKCENTCNGKYWQHKS